MADCDQKGADLQLCMKSLLILNVTEDEARIYAPIKDDLVLLGLQYWHHQMNFCESNSEEHKRSHITFRASANAAGWWVVVYSYYFSQASLI